MHGAVNCAMYCAVLLAGEVRPSCPSVDVFATKVYNKQASVLETACGTTRGYGAAINDSCDIVFVTAVVLVKLGEAVSRPHKRQRIVRG